VKFFITVSIGDPFERKLDQNDSYFQTV